MSLRPESLLGPYEIVAFPGAGNKGEVYKARNTKLNRLVALKLLLPELAMRPRGGAFSAKRRPRPRLSLWLIGMVVWTAAATSFTSSCSSA